MLGKNLYFIRKAIDYSQDEFASLFGLRRTTYSNYEQGNNEPTLSFMEQLIDITGIDLKTFRNVNIAEKYPVEVIRSLFIKHALKASKSKTAQS
jgi:transcriptional regulator with XRE-family HTH domain